MRRKREVSSKYGGQLQILPFLITNWEDLLPNSYVIICRLGNAITSRTLSCRP